VKCVDLTLNLLLKAEKMVRRFNKAVVFWVMAVEGTDFW